MLSPETVDLCLSCLTIPLLLPVCSNNELISWSDRSCKPFLIAERISLVHSLDLFQ